MGREYVSLDESFGYWRDTHLKITGSAVLALHIRFILDWNYATKQNLFHKDEYFKDHFRKPPGNEAVQIITSGPDSKEQNIRNTYLKLIGKAREHIYIQTPYFVPDETVLDATGCYVIPGLVDVHFHGCVGEDFSDATPEGLQKIADFELSQGVTYICPAGMTLPEEELTAICKSAFCKEVKPKFRLYFSLKKSSRKPTRP